jgi:hypothetical protein
MMVAAFHSNGFTQPGAEVRFADFQLQLAQSGFPDFGGRTSYHL